VWLTLAVIAFGIAVAVAWMGALGGAGALLAVVALGVAFGGYGWGRRAWATDFRRKADTIARLLVTFGAFVALLRHPLRTGEVVVPMHDALVALITTTDLRTLLLWGALAMVVKLVAVVASAAGWWWALRGQGVHAPFFQTVLSGFLIGRFIGTFLPSTVGLDAYTMWEMGRVTGDWSRVLVAKIAEKMLGMTALFLGVMLALPVLWDVFVAAFGVSQGAWAWWGIALGSTALVSVVSVGWVVPGVWTRLALACGRWLPARIGRSVERMTSAALRYKGQFGVVVLILGFKLASHLGTAIVYWLTARGIGLIDAPFLPIVSGSLLQIVGTLVAPTVGGEGVREALQALLLSAYYEGDPAKAVLSATLGFVAAEAATMWGGIFLWTRGERWRPAFLTIDGAFVSSVEHEDPPRIQADTESE
jgi:uncharacterized membrane protein YbhN (UPF0104 family)